jgi:hypothetical protein
MLKRYILFRNVGSRSGDSDSTARSQALEAAAWSPELGLRGGASPARGVPASGLP